MDSRDSNDNPSRTSAGRERRRYPRTANPPIVVQILGTISHVKDVSATGLQVEKTFALPTGATEEIIPMTVYRLTGDRLDVNHALRLTGVLVRDGDREVGIRLDPPTLALVRLIVEPAAKPAAKSAKK